MTLTIATLCTARPGRGPRAGTEAGCVAPLSREDSGEHSQWPGAGRHRRREGPWLSGSWLRVSRARVPLCELCSLPPVLTTCSTLNSARTSLALRLTAQASGGVACHPTRAILSNLRCVLREHNVRYPLGVASCTQCPPPSGVASQRCVPLLRRGVASHTHAILRRGDQVYWLRRPTSS